MIQYRRFYPILASVAVVILIHQAIDVMSALPSSDLATPMGRTRQLLTALARGPAGLTADAILIWALVADDRLEPLRALGLIHYGLAGLCLLALPVFVVDAGRLASTFGGGEVTGFRIVSLRTILLLVLLGAGALKVGRLLRIQAGEPTPAKP